MTARPLYAQYTELDADNSYEGNDLEKGKSLYVITQLALLFLNCGCICKFVDYKLLYIRIHYDQKMCIFCIMQ